MFQAEIHKKIEAVSFEELQMVKPSGIYKGMFDMAKSTMCANGYFDEDGIYRINGNTTISQKVFIRSICYRLDIKHSI